MFSSVFLLLGFFSLLHLPPSSPPCLFAFFSLLQPFVSQIDRQISRLVVVVVVIVILFYFISFPGFFSSAISGHKRNLIFRLRKQNRLRMLCCGLQGF